MAAPAFPLRFKDPTTKDMLRLVADQLGVPMNDIAEDAVRQELVLLGAGIEQQLSTVVEALRGYRPERHAQAMIDAYVAGEANEDPMQARQLTGRPGAEGDNPPVTEPSAKLRSALAAFKR